MALQPSPCLTVTAADPTLDFIYACDEELFENLVVGFWSEHKATAPQCLCWVHPTDALHAEHHHWGNAFSTDIIYLQADKM